MAAKANGGQLTLCAVGDVLLDREKPASAFAQVKEVFRQADILFGNCEGVYTETKARNPIAWGALSMHPRNMEGVAAAGFHVMSFANNHNLDKGYEGFFDTLALLRKHGIASVGAGKSIAEARAPVIVKRGKTRVAFLAYASVFMPGYEAGPTKPGLAPVRAHTFYHQVELGNPATHPEILSFAYPKDLAAMKEDIRKTRGQADIVVASYHWGIHNEPAVIADYEKEIGRAAVDAGADLVLGHHQHILKGIEVYKGKVIFYGMGNFIFDLRIEEVVSKAVLKIMRQQYGPYAVGPRAGYPAYPFHPDARWTMIVKCQIKANRIQEVSFIPCLINRQGQPVPVAPGGQAFDKALRYVKSVTRKAGFDTGFAVTGPAVNVIA
ncbi:MAG: CapA family protein [Chloroflexi bacterium]|nr:CapA family protein [Chloroflexota bacterium]